MSRFTIPRRAQVTLVALLASLAVAPAALAQSAVKLKGEGAINLSAEGPSPFMLSGTASHLGKYACYGESAFFPGGDAGSLDGDGLAAIEAANGDLLVGVVTWQFDADGTGHVAFSWRNFVVFSDGTVVFSTGRFAASRPPGATGLFTYRTGSGIIAILIG